MKKIIALILGMFFLFGSISWAEPPELLKQGKIVIRPELQPVEGECYLVSEEGNYSPNKNWLIEISYSYLYHDCQINEVSCVTTNTEIVKHKENWEKASVTNGRTGSYSTVSYFFKVIGKGECDIILTIDGKPYTYHFSCG